MPGQAYLTIDDSPGPRTSDLVDFLDARGITALLFCRGDLLAHDPAPVIKAISSGHVIGNHLYHHKSASERDAAEVINDISATEELIDDAYARAGATRPGRYIRFPYMDRDYNWFLPDSKPDQQALTQLHQVFDNLDVPGPANPLSGELADKRACLQDYLIHEGFTQPLAGITYDWYRQARLHEMPDSPFTVNTYDWMLTKRHLARGWPYQSIVDLQSRLRAHPFLNDTGARDIVLAHDQAEIFDVTTGLVAFMQDEMGIEFIGDFA